MAAKTTSFPSFIKDEVWTLEQQQQEMKRRLDIFNTILHEWIAIVPKFNPRPSDVICVVQPKSGTTWVTHICHQIRMKGIEPDFKEQTEVVYWLEVNKVKYGIDPDDVVQPAEPRLFVTHFTRYDEVPKSKRMIYVCRDEIDVLYSGYRMRNSVFMLRGRVSFDVYTQLIIHEGVIRERLEQLVDWWGRRHHDYTLFLFYDDLKEDHEGCVRRIAKFIGIECSDEIISRVVHTTTHAEMSKYSSKFDSVVRMPSLLAQFGEEENKQQQEKVGRVRKDGGRSGDGCKNLSSGIKEQIDKLWSEIVTAKLGFKNLSEMRQALHVENCKV